MKTLLSTLILGAGLVLGGCGDNQKYKEFKKFISEKGKSGKNNVNRYVEFSVNEGNFFCGYTTFNLFAEGIFIEVNYGEIKESFFDHGSDGLDNKDFYLKSDKNGHVLKNSVSKSEKLRYDNFIKDIPKIYEYIQH